MKKTTPVARKRLTRVLLARAQEVARREEADCFVELVRDYAALGYSRFSVAHRLLGISDDTLQRYLEAHGATIEFKSPGEPGYQTWHEPVETAAKSLASRIRNGNMAFLTLDGQTLHIGEWARRTGIGRSTIYRRISSYGWSVRDALTVPVGARRGPKNPHRTKHQKGAMDWLFR